VSPRERPIGSIEISDARPQARNSSPPRAAEAVARAGVAPRPLGPLRRYGDRASAGTPHIGGVDFDFFTDVDLDEAEKARLLENACLQGADVLQNDENTLTVSVKTGAGPVKASFFGGLKCGRIGEPDRTDDGVACVASLEDLLAHKLKVVHDRAAGRDYQDIAAILASGQDLARGVAGAQALFKPGMPAMVLVKALIYFEDVKESWRLTDEVKATLIAAAADLPARLDPLTVISTTLHCDLTSGPRFR
jgi:hypothetical protein